MGITMYNGLRKTRDVTKDSPKQITEIVTFVKRLYPRTKPSNGDWQVVVVNSKEYKEDFILTGNMIAMEDYEEYEAEYKIVANLEWNDKREEWGYVVTYSQELYEFKTIEDQYIFLNTFLNEKQIKGIFDMYDNPIQTIEDFGAEALVKVKGIGIKTAERIVDKYIGCKDKSKAYVELCGLGLSTSIVDKLILRYHSPDIAIDKIKDNPYILIKDIKGVGFRKADEIAMKMGFSSDDVRRCVAFVYYFFNSKADDGDCYTEYDEFLNELDNVLGVDYPDESINKAMKQLDSEGELWVKDYINDDGYEYTLLGLKKYYDIEKEICYHLTRLMSAENKTVIDEEIAIQHIREQEEKQGWNFTERQLEGIFTCMNNNVTIIIGYGGTGKTSAVSGMLACMDEDFDFEQCALSGKASVNLADITGKEGKTIHSLLGYTPETNTYQYDEKHKLYTDLVILDEASMIDIELALRLLRAIPNGAKLIMLGDTNQLEGIGAGNFLLDMIDSGKIPVVLFDKVHRQGAKSAIKTESINVAEGKRIVKSGWQGTEIRGELQDLKLIGFNHNKSVNTKRPSIDLIMEEFKEVYKKVKNIEDIVVAVPTKTNGTGCLPINKLIQDYVLPKKRSESIRVGDDKDGFDIYVGDKVINLKNNRKTYGYEEVIKDGIKVIDKITRPIYNGNIGEVIEIIDETSIIVDFYNIGEVIVKDKQLQQLALGYAITVHKLQGSTIPYVIGCVDYSHYTMLNRQLVYTLMSRAKYELRFIFETNALLKAISTNKVSTKRTFLYHFLIGELE